MNRHTLVRGFSVLSLILIFSLIGSEQGSQLAFAGYGRSTAFGQYLPIIHVARCVPRAKILPNDVEKDLALENGINEVRMNYGLPTLEHSDKIAQAALRHSNDMANNGITSHIGSDGSDPGNRLEEACYHWQAYGEVLAAGYHNPAEAIAAWMDSPEHKAIILSGLYVDYGGAYAYNKNTPYKYFYTVDFGLPEMASDMAWEKYYSCTYTREDEVGAVWLSLYSIWPCEKQLSSLRAGEITSPK